MQKLMGDEGWGGPCFSLLTPSVCDWISQRPLLMSGLFPVEWQLVDSYSFASNLIITCLPFELAFSSVVTKKIHMSRLLC